MKQQQELIPLATGEYLKNLRLKRKLSLSDVARAVYLDEKVLGDIEEDKADHIALHCFTGMDTSRPMPGSCKSLRMKSRHYSRQLT